MIESFFMVDKLIGQYLIVVITQDVFDLPFRMARGQIEESLRTKMASIKVFFLLRPFPFTQYQSLSVPN